MNVDSKRIWNTGNFTQLVFFGNYFYGICAVALAVEASLQQRYTLNDVLFYVCLFAGSTWFYTKAYITAQTSLTINERTNWYIQHKTFVKCSQHTLEIILGISLLFFLKNNGAKLLQIKPLHLLLILIFPIVAGLYYGINSRIIGNFNLRKIGWIKPFLIGFTWAGLVTVYPIIYYAVVNQAKGDITVIGFLLFIKNFMFVTVLCIMFDIKDYAMDYNHQLKTFVVKKGLRHTIFYILIPLSIAGLASFLVYGFAMKFSAMKLILNIIPFLCMIGVAYSLHQRKSILYYLILIDGLMLLKAICGSIAVSFF